MADTFKSASRLFADGSSLAARSREKNCIESIINDDLEIISYSANYWLIKFNVAKTEVIYFLLLSKNNLDTPDIYFKNIYPSFSSFS